MEKEQMKIVIIGHIDHGKSTLIGRLLFETNSIPQSTVDEVKKICEELGKEMEFSYLLDSLEEEREQNITIDTTQIFFNTDKRDYVIIDAPGHVEFIKNMVTGASQAEAAILIVDVNEGVKEQTKRHAYIIKMLGIKQIIVVVNKMDSVDFDSDKFNKIKNDVSRFLNELDIEPRFIIPISALRGSNVAKRYDNVGWYNGLSLLEALGTLDAKGVLSHKSLRFPIQDVYKIKGETLPVGKVEAGTLKQGDEVIFLPSNKKSKIKSIEVWNRNKIEAEAGESIGITLDKPLFIKRGDIMCSGSLPKITDKFNATIFWMSNQPVMVNEKLILKCVTQEIKCILEKIKNKINTSTLEVIGKNCEELCKTEVGDVIIKTEKPIVMGSFNDLECLGRFVLIKDDDTVAGGVVPR